MLIEQMEHGISLSNGENLSQSQLSEMHYISYGTCEYKMHTDLCFEAKKFQFELDFHLIIGRKNVLQ